MKNKIISLLITISLVLSMVVPYMSTVNASSVLISQGKKVYMLENGWDGPQNVVDGNNSTQWHSVNTKSALYIDLGAEYDLTNFELIYPDGYFNDGNTDYKLQVISRIPDTIYPDSNGNQITGNYGVLLSDQYDVLETLGSGNTNQYNVTSTVAAGNVRYLRYVADNHSASGSNAKLSELKIYGTESATTLVSSGKAIYCLDEAWDAPASAVDNKIHFEYGGALVDSQWHGKFSWGVLYVDLGQEYELSKVQLAYPDGYFANGSTKFKVQAISKIPDTIQGNYIIGDNGALMGDVDVTATLYDGTANAKIVTAALTPATTRYVRYLVYDNNTGMNAKLAELRIFGKTYVDNTPAGSIISEGKTIYGLASAWDGPEAAVDGNLNNQWHSKFGWGALYLDLGAEYDVSGLRLTYPDGYFAAGSTKFKVQAISKIPDTISGSYIIGDNGALMGDVDIVSTIYDGTANTKTVTQNATALHTRYIRYLVCENNTGMNAKLAELQLFGTKNVVATDALLSSISVNGGLIVGFDADKSDYEYLLASDTATATITVTTNDPLAQAIVTNVTGSPFGKTASIEVTAQDGITTKTYNVTFKSDELISQGKNVYALDNSWETPANIVDGILSNQWHGSFGWGIVYFDLGAVYDLSRMEVYFPTDYLTGAGIKFKLQTINEIPSQIVGDTIKGDNGAIMGLPVIQTLYDGTVAAGTTEVKAGINGGQGRYLRLFIYQNDMKDSSGTSLNAKLAEVKLFGAQVIQRDDATLSSITVNNMPITSFSSTGYEYKYSISSDTINEMTVGATTTAPGATVEITQTGSNPIGKIAIIKVTALDGTTTKTYNVTFTSDILVSKNKLALGYVTSYNPAKNALDDDMSTTWKSFATWGCLYVDLGEEYDLSRFQLSFPHLANGNWKFKVDSINSMPDRIGDDTVDNPLLLGDSVLKNSLYNNSAGAIEGDNFELNITGKARYIRLYIAGNSGFAGSELVEVKEFKVYANEPEFEAKLKDIKVGGVSLEGFKESTLSYFYELDEGVAIPDVTALATTSVATVQITPATELPGRTLITVTSGDLTRINKYYITFVVKDNKSYLVSNSKKTVAFEAFGIPGYMVDGDRNTAYVSEKSSATLFIDLGMLYKITRVQVIFTDGSTENWKFKLDKLSTMPSFSGKYTSQTGDDLVLENIFDGTDGSYIGDDVVAFTNKDARYARLTIDENTSVEHAGIKELMVYGYPVGSEEASLKDIKVDGTSLVGFAGNIQKYFIDIPFGSTEIPVITAEQLDINANVSIRQAETIDGIATITVTSSDNEQVLIYEIQFVPLKENQSIISNGKTVKASSSQVGFEASKGMDGNLLTAWKPEKSTKTYTYEIDLGGIFTVERILNQFFDGKSNDVYSIVVDGSIDGIYYSRIYNSNEDKEAGQNLNMNFNAVARFVRISYFGVNGFYNEPVALSEISLYGTPFVSMINEVKIDGVKFAPFNEGIYDYNYVYNVSGSKIPQITVDAIDGAVVAIEQASTQSGITIFTVTAFGTTRTYNIQMNPIYGELIELANPTTSDNIPFTVFLIILSSVLGALVIINGKIKANKNKTNRI